MRSTAAAPALLTLALLVGAAGCGSGSADARPEPASTAAPAFGTGTRPVDGGYGSGNQLGLTGVRTEGKQGYDRVVFELGGRGTPGWYVSYTKRPRADGSGERVRLQGDVYLQVVLRGLGMPFDTGVPQYGDDTTRVPGTGTEGVAEIAPGGVFEGDQLGFVGLTGERRPFRVFALTDPARVVVDVRHSEPAG